MGSVSFLLIPDRKDNIDFAIFVLQSHSTTCGCITSYSQRYRFFSFWSRMSSIELIGIHYIPLQSHCNSLQSIANWLHSAIHCKLIAIYHNPLQTHCNILYVFANSCFIQNAHINTTFYNYILTLRTSMQMLNGGHVFFSAQKLDRLVQGWQWQAVVADDFIFVDIVDKTGAQITPPELFSAFVFSMAPVTASNHWPWPMVRNWPQGGLR